MSQNPRPKSKRSAKTPAVAMDPEIAQRHLAAYFFALYGGCECEACQLLRPIAEKMIADLKAKKEVIPSG